MRKLGKLSKEYFCISFRFGLRFQSVYAIIYLVLKASLRKLVQTEPQTDEENTGAQAGEQRNHLGGTERGAEEKAVRVGLYQVWIFWN